MTEAFMMRNSPEQFLNDRAHMRADSKIKVPITLQISEICWLFIFGNFA